MATKLDVPENTCDMSVLSVLIKAGGKGDGTLPVEHLHNPLRMKAHLGWIRAPGNTSIHLSLKSGIQSQGPEKV